MPGGVLGELERMGVKKISMEDLQTVAEDDILPENGRFEYGV